MTERNDALRQRVKQMRRKHPHRSAADMARELGVSRQRVRALLVAMGLPTVVRTPVAKREGVQ